MKALENRLRKLETNVEGEKRHHTIIFPKGVCGNNEKEEAFISEYEKTNKVGPHDLIVSIRKYAKPLGQKGNGR